MLLDRFIASLALLAALYMARRGPAHGINDLLPGGTTATLLYLGVAAAILITVWGLHRRTRAARVIGRLVAYPAAFLLVMIGVGRARTLAQGFPAFPPLAAVSLANRLDELSPLERAEWGTRIAAHRWSDQGSDSATLVIPADWPFPSDVQVARRRTPDGDLEVWAKTGDGTAACLTLGFYVSHGSDSLAERARCERQKQAPVALVFATPLRSAPTNTPVVMGPLTMPPTREAWAQYRRDATHTGSTRSAAADAPGVEWTTQLDGPARASASIVGELVLIGAHETGALAAIDVHSGLVKWTARVPNWIHQDVVSDGQVAVVGFGNVWPSMAGRAPSGVAAYSLDTGASLWTVFDESSVMTSAIVRDSIVVYATAAGTLRKRSLRTGALLDTLQLPGGVIMGPPVARGDTLAAALDENGLCTVRISTFEMLWCRTIPGLRMVGHASPTIVDGLLLVSGPGKLRAASPSYFATLPFKQQLSLLWNAFGPEDGYVGQQVRAFDLQDGTPRWSTPFFPPDEVGVEGHSAGTAVIAGNLGLIVLPFSDVLVAFEVETGAIRWTAEAHHGRGVPLVIDGDVFIAGRDGVIETRDLETGALHCTISRPVGFDRVGPARADSTLVFATLRGAIIAEPLSHFTQCLPGEVRHSAAAVGVSTHAGSGQGH